MERFFALLITLLLAASSLYLLIAFIIIPVVKMIKENARLKR